jgi:lysophospholipase
MTLMLAVCWLLSTGSAAQTNDPVTRENNYKQFYQNQVLPFFKQGTHSYFEGQPVDGREISLRFSAFPRQRAKADIILVHGFGERLEKYQELAYDFYHNGYSVYLYDQRGHGGSSRINTTNRAVHVKEFKHYVEDLTHFIDKVVTPTRTTPNLFILAHSMGGAVTTRLLETRPKLVQGAVLSTPMLGMNLRGVPRWLAWTLAHGGSLLGFGESYGPGQSEPRDWPFQLSATQSLPRWDVYAEFSQNSLPDSELTGGASFRWLATALDATAEIMEPDQLRQIKTPTLVFQAEWDQWVRPEPQDRFCQIVTNCRLIKVDKAKHELYREQDSIRTDYLQTVFSFFEKTRQKRLSTLP